MSEEDPKDEPKVDPEIDPKDAPEPKDDDIVERAKSQGWVPKEEFRGPDHIWVDAEEFVKRGENELPILRERSRNMEKQIREMKETLKEFAKHHKDVSEREYNRALEAIKRQKAEAVSLGDADAYSKAEAHEEQLKEHRPKAIEIKDDEPGEHPEFQSWLADNPWYANDKAAHAVADTIAAELAQTSNLQGRAFFDAVKEQVKKELPHKFENSKRSAPAAVEGASTVRKPGKKGYADLPPEAKEACDKFVKQGLLTKEQYIKEFYGEQK